MRARRSACLSSLAALFLLLCAPTYSAPGSPSAAPRTAAAQPRLAELAGSVTLSADGGSTITWTSADRSTVLKAPLRRVVEP